MYYVYILQSKKDLSYYKGITQNLKQRLYDHNHGSNKYSSSKAPWVLVWYCAFNDKQKAVEFETYIKQGSGAAFIKKHIL